MSRNAKTRALADRLQDKWAIRPDEIEGFFADRRSLRERKADSPETKLRRGQIGQIVALRWQVGLIVVAAEASNRYGIYRADAAISWDFPFANNVNEMACFLMGEDKKKKERKPA